MKYQVSNQVTTFLAICADKRANGTFQKAIDVCNQSLESFLRTYCAIAVINLWDPAELIYRFNDLFLDGKYQSKDIDPNIKFYVSAINRIPQVSNRKKKTKSYC